MAHMIEMVDGKASIAYAGATPWHGLGKRVLPDLTPEQMLVEAGLDWEVEKMDLTYQYEGKNIVAGGNKALVRTSDGSLLDVVGDDWNPLQNADAFEFFSDFVAAGDMEMHTAGSLSGGQRVWALAKVNESFEIFKGDQIDQYLLFSKPHKYGMSIDVRMTPIRVVCNNTLTMSLNAKSENMVKINHCRTFDAEFAKEKLGIASKKLEVYKEAAKFLGSKNCTKENVVEYFKRLFPASEKMSRDGRISRNAQTAMEVLNTQPGAEFGRGTYWNAFNTVTYMTDHLMGRSADTRLQSAWFGSNRNKKMEALEVALEMAEAA